MENIILLILGLTIYRFIKGSGKCAFSDLLPIGESRVVNPCLTLSKLTILASYLFIPFIHFIASVVTQANFSLYYILTYIRYV